MTKPIVHLTYRQIRDLALKAADSELKAFAKAHLPVCKQDCRELFDQAKRRGDWHKVTLLKKNHNGSLKVRDSYGVFDGNEYHIGGPPTDSGIKLRIGQRLEVEFIGFYCFTARTLTRPARWWSM